MRSLARLPAAIAGALLTCVAPAAVSGHIPAPLFPPPPPVLAAAPLMAAPPALSALRGAGQTRPRSRLFPPQDLGLLEAPDRDQWQKPDLIMDALLIADSAVVGDVGAGGGWFTIRLARRVGPNGIVYAEDIQPQMIEAISRRVQREGLTNVRTVHGTARDPRLPANLDAVLIVDAYREIEDPVVLLKSVARSLKPQGRIGIVDFTPGGGGPGPAPDERVAPEEVIKAAAAAGLKLLAREDVPPFQFLIVFGKEMHRFSARSAVERLMLHAVDSTSCARS